MSAEPFIGEIQAFGFDFAPRGWVKCDGELLAISQNEALFVLLGTTYGGDGRTTFALPDLRGRSMVGAGDGAGPGLSDIHIGRRGGVESVTITTAEMPSHTHTAALYAETANADLPNPAGAMLAFTDKGHSIYATPTATVNQKLAPESIQVGESGEGQSLYIRNPYLGVNICIATVGIFPPRD